MRELSFEETFQVSGASYGNYGAGVAGAVDNAGNQDGDPFDEYIAIYGGITAGAGVAGLTPVAGAVAAAAALIDTFLT
ncbi:MAG: hypothetical protein AAFX09_07145 [Pseudomonadota bacterium]